MGNKSQVQVGKSEILTIKEVAEYLRMSEAKIYRLLKQGVFSVVRIGKTWRFRKDLLDAWLRDFSEVQAQPPCSGQPDWQE